MQTRIYRRHHDAILCRIETIERMIASAGERDLRTELTRLNGVVAVHLSLEDGSLYPKLLAHNDRTVRELAARYQREMGDLCARYGAFSERWGAIGAILADRKAFVAEFKVVASAIRQRIERENHELYELVDMDESPPLVVPNLSR
jgi:hypothetical protein